MLSQQASRHSELSEHTSNTTVPSLVLKLPQKTTDNKLTAPSVVHFKAVLQGLVLGASLLPSLRARYKMEEVQCTGVTGIKPKCTVDLPAHSLSFTSRVRYRFHILFPFVSYFKGYMSHMKHFCTLYTIFYPTSVQYT